MSCLTGRFPHHFSSVLSVHKTALFLSIASFSLHPSLASREEVDAPSRSLYRKFVASFPFSAAYNQDQPLPHLNCFVLLAVTHLYVFSALCYVAYILRLVLIVVVERSRSVMENIELEPTELTWSSVPFGRPCPRKRNAHSRLRGQRHWYVDRRLSAHGGMTRRPAQEKTAEKSCRDRCCTQLAISKPGGVKDALTHTSGFTSSCRGGQKRPCRRVGASVVLLKAPQDGS